MALNVSFLTLVKGADMFLGVSGPGALPADLVREMAQDPIIFALAYPTPEIMPEEARAASPVAMIATGRSDYPNQVNNVLCFPFIFRGALDAYRAALEAEVFKSPMIMRPVFDAARQAKRRIVFAEGEDIRVLRAVQSISEDSIATPILVGRPEIIEQRIARAGLTIRPEVDFLIVNTESDERYRDYWSTYHHVMRRDGVTPDVAKDIMHTNATAIAATMVHRGDADSMICGTVGQYLWHLNYVTQVLQSKVMSPVGALSLMILDDGALFVADTHVNIEQTPETLAATVIAAARHVRRFGLVPGNRLTGRANVLVYANTDAAGAARNLLKNAAGGLEIGPIPMGMANRAHIVTPGISVRGLTNIAALAGSAVAGYG